MNNDARLFLKYLRLLSRQWALWAFLALDVVGLAAVASGYSIPISPLGFYFFALAGLVWAGFRVFRATHAQIPRNSQEVKPQILVELVEGSEYNFVVAPKSTEEYEDLLEKAYARRAILANYRDQKEFTNHITEEDHYIAQLEESIELTKKENILSNTDAYIYITITNIGQVDVSIISITASYEEREAPWTFLPGNITDFDENILGLPLELKKDQSIQCEINSIVSPKATNNSKAHFAALLANINVKNPLYIDAKITVQVVDTTRRIYAFDLPCKVSLRPLKEEYINIWKDLNQIELLRLAGVMNYTSQQDITIETASNGASQK